MAMIPDEPMQELGWLEETRNAGFGSTRPPFQVFEGPPEWEGEQPPDADIGKKVREYMRGHVEECIQGSGRPDLLWLTELAADHFQLYDDPSTYEIPKWMYALCNKVWDDYDEEQSNGE